MDEELGELMFKTRIETKQKLLLPLVVGGCMDGTSTCRRRDQHTNIRSIRGREGCSGLFQGLWRSSAGSRGLGFYQKTDSICGAQPMNAEGRLAGGVSKRGTKFEEAIANLLYRLLHPRSDNRVGQGSATIDKGMQANLGILVADPRSRKPKAHAYGASLPRCCSR